MIKWIMGFIVLFLLSPPLWADQWQELNLGVKPPARAGHAIAVLNNAIYIFGGQPEGVLANDVGKYGLANDLWKYSEDGWVQETPANNPPEERTMSAMAATAQKVYMFGGGNKFGAVLGDLWSYNPANKNWTQEDSQGDIPPARQYHTMVALQSGQLIVLGGIDAQGQISDHFVRSYEPATGTWLKQKAPPEVLSYGHTATAVGNSMYLFGGFNDTYKNDVWIYDLAQDTWTKVTPHYPLTNITSQQAAAPSPRIFNTISTYGKSFFIFGGKFTSELNDNWEFNTNNNTWTQRANLPVSMQLAQAGAILKNNEEAHIMFGGRSNGVAVDKTYQYSPNEETVSITSFTPESGKVGTKVTISGENFSSKKKRNIVKFARTAATVLSVNNDGTILKVIVPSGAKTGYITVTVGKLTGKSKKKFRVIK